MEHDFFDNLDPVERRMAEAMLQRLASPAVAQWRELAAREIEARVARGDFDEPDPDDGIAAREPLPRSPRDPSRGAHADAAD